MLQRAYITVALTLAAGAAAAQDAPTTYFYLKSFAGLTLARDMSLDPTHPEFSFEYDYGAGSAFGVALGYWIAPSVALELEGAQRTSEAEVYAAYNEDLSGAVDRWTFDETVRVRSVMVNVVYSPPVGQTARVRPYAGAGIGQAIVEFGPDDTDWEPAWQLFGGVARALSPRLDLLGEVRWFDAKGGIILDPGTPYETGGGFESVDVIVSLAYRF